MHADPLVITSAAVVMTTAALLVIALVVTQLHAPRRPLLPTVVACALFISLAAGFFAEWAAALWFVGFPLLAAIYPSGRFVPRWTVVPIGVFALATIAYYLTGGAIADQPWWWTVGTGGLVMLAAQVYRYRRRATTAERESVRWAIVGTAVTAQIFLLLIIFGSGEIGVGEPIAIALSNFAILPLMLGIAIGLVRPAALNIDVALSALTGATVAVPVLAMAYAGAGAVAARLGADVVSAGWWGAAAVGAFAYPVVRVAARFANWLVYRGRPDAASAVELLGRRVATQTGPRSIAEAVVQTVVDAVHVDGAALRGEGVLAARVGELGPAAEEFPIVFRGEELAVLVVPPRRGESALTRNDRSVVESIAVHAGPALHGARALAQLRDAHARLVRAREEERRRLRRDLHDDLSPTLSGLALEAAAVARRAEGSDPGLGAAAAELHDDIQAAVEQSREITHGLRPPILDDRGLVAAIRDRMHGQHADGLEVDLRAPLERLDLPAAVDLSALRIVQEAVANVRRHAQATRCLVTLALQPEGARPVELRVVVDDDGIGFPPQLRPGIGIASIRERATELGGSARFERGPLGGGRVDVILPIEIGEAT